MIYELSKILKIRQCTDAWYPKAHVKSVSVLTPGTQRGSQERQYSDVWYPKGYPRYIIPSVITLTFDTEAFPDWWTNFLWSTMIGQYNSQSPWAVLIGQMGLDKKEEQGSSFKVTHQKRQCTDAWYRKA